VHMLTSAIVEINILEIPHTRHLHMTRGQEGSKAHLKADRSRECDMGQKVHKGSPNGTLIVVSIFIK
jgi:hypothetical protein